MQTIKINLTAHERELIVIALQETETLIGTALANKILAQDPADDGPEVAILSAECLTPLVWRNGTGWGS